jgi:prepilin-type N-terminal cleavage/methylation domain-containing protein
MDKSGSACSPRPGGFSLIEVLIAVVVLSVGMLAMAALQGSLTRASVDAKNRTYALNILHESLDSRRALIEEAPLEYETLASTGPAAATGPDGMGAYTLTSTVTRFVSSADPAVCGGAPAPCFIQRNDNLDPRQGPEFKRVEVTIAWTDAANRELALSLSDVFSSVPASASRDLLDRSIKVGSAGGPRVRIRPPSDIGVIPIAVGDGTEATAASNPRPTLHDRGYTDKTSFEVFQYRPYGNNEALLTQKIEVVSVGCNCELTAPQQQTITETDLFFAQPREPLYWNGTSYAGAQLAPKTRRQGRPAGVFQDVNLCTTCCSDHHDHTAGKVKLDSFRPKSDFSVATGNHNHYPRNGIVPVSSGQAYHEVCRMIRKDGFMLVATDARLAQMNLLETNIEESRKKLTAVPKTTVVGRYQAFVRDYLAGKLLRPGNPNTTDPLTESLKSDYFDLLELPRTIDMLVADPNYYLHDRGLLLDYLEQEALDEIKDAIDNCNGTGDSALLDCILLKLPIVTLNATDIAQWRAEAKNYVTVTNMSRNANVIRFDDTTTGAGLGNRGIVRARATGGENVTVRMGRSNSGLADVNPTDPCDGGKNDEGWNCAAELLEDVQSFCVGGDCGDQNQGGRPFYVNVSSADINFTKAGLGLTWIIPSLDAGPCANANPEDVGKDYRCVVHESVELPKSVNLTVNGYNRSYQKEYTNPCKPNQTVMGWVCVNYRLASATVDGTALTVPSPTGDDGYANEATTISGVVNALSTFELLFDKQGEIERTPTCNVDVKPNQVVIPTCDLKN